MYIYTSMNLQLMKLHTHGRAEISMPIITKIKVNTLIIITVLYAEVLQNLCMKPFDDDEIIEESCG